MRFEPLVAAGDAGRSQSRLQRSESWGLLLALAMLVAVAGLAYRSVEAAAETLGLVEHTNQVLQQLQEVTAANARASTARRVFIVTGDASQLPDRAQVDARLQRALAEVRALVLDNPSQVRRVDAFDGLVAQRLTDLDASVAQRQRDGSASETAEGIALGARIRTVREEMEGEENRLLADRDSRTRRDVKRTKIAETVGTGVSLALLLFVFTRLRREIGRRRESEEALRRAKEAADVSNRELEAFSYSVAHDLRAPLRAIDGFGAALAEDCGPQLDDLGRDYLSRIRAAAQQMGQLIDGLLGLSRVTRADLARLPVDLTQLARQSADRLKEANPQRAVDLVIQEGLVGEGDARLLTVTLDNLLGNAWKFTRKEPRARIEVGALREPGGSVFFVKDNGAGFDPAYSQKLFGAFQRLHAANEFEGSGIGLATVERIVRRHGGRIWAEGAVGHGATFYFTL